METPETIYDETVMTHQEACAATLGDIFDKTAYFEQVLRSMRDAGLVAPEEGEV